MVLSGPEPEGHACSLLGLPNFSSVVAPCGAYWNPHALAIARIDGLAGHTNFHVSEGLPIKYTIISLEKI